MSNAITPSLFIGLGGTGSNILLPVKKSLIEYYGEVPPAIEFLCFDTDAMHLTQQVEVLTKTDLNGDIHTQDIRLDHDEIILMDIHRDFKQFIQQEHIKTWLSPRTIAKINSGDGLYSGSRELGRLAFFQNYRTAGIEEKIRDKIISLLDIRHTINQEYYINIEEYSPNIHIVLSPCGGTGGAIFTDVIMTIRKINPNVRIVGWMVMPGFYKDFHTAHHVIPNAYAAMMEIDHLMGKDARPPETNWSNYPQKPYEMNYTGDGSNVSLNQEGLFDYLYTFDNIDDKGRSISIGNIFKRISVILKMLTSNYIDSTLYHFSSINSHYMMFQMPNGKRSNYHSIGISQIILDKNILKSLKVNRIITQVLKAYCFKDEISDEGLYIKFVSSNFWLEYSRNDDIIDRMISRSQLNYDLDTLYPSKYKKGEWNVEVKNKVDAFLICWDEKIISNCKRIRDEIIIDFNQKLSNEISKYISNTGGISQCKLFLRFIIKFFSELADKKENESDSHRSEIERLYGYMPKYSEFILEKENSFNPLGKEKRVKEVTWSFIKHSEKILLEKWQKTRKDHAKLFYDICVASLHDSLNQIVAIEQLLTEVISDLERKNRNIMNRCNTESDFERYIHYYDKEMLYNNKAEINLEEAFKEIDFTSLLNFRKVSDIKSLIQNYVVKTTALEAIDQLTVEKILQRLDKDTIKNIINYLDTSSEVCMDVDQSSFPQIAGKSYLGKKGIMCMGGGEDIFDRAFYENISSDDVDYYNIPTGDHDRITNIKMAGPFPACAIKRMKEYKEQYIKSVENGHYHFSDNYFEKYAQDLLDGPDNEVEILKWFTVGSALGKIYLYKGGLHLEYYDKQMQPLFEGTRGKTDRFQCSKLFRMNKEYVNHISEFYNQFYDEKGKLAIKEKFIWFYKNITSVEILGKPLKSMDPKSDEYLNISVEKELLKTFGMENGIRPDEFGDE